MAENPFASYTVEIPKKYADDVKKYCQTAGAKVTHEFAPFKRQVDFWYFAFVVAVNRELDPTEESETSNITPGSILSSDPERISHIQLAYLGKGHSLAELANHRAVFDYALSMANSGIPYVLQLLSDPDDRPLWGLLDDTEARLSKHN